MNQPYGQPDFDPRFAPPGATPYYDAPQQREPNHGPLVVGALVVAAIVGGIYFVSTKGGGGGEPSYKTVTGAGGLRIDVPEYFREGRIINAPGAKIGCGDDEEVVSVVVHSFKKSDFEEEMSLKQLFDKMVEFMEIDGEVEEMSPTVSASIGGLQALQQTTTGKVRGKHLRALQTVVESETHFYTVEVSAPVKDWELWEARATLITNSFVVE